MNVIAIETSTQNASIALLAHGQMHQQALPSGSAQSEQLLPLMSTLLGAADLAPNQIDVVAFSAGPGAFTGLRLACAAAQAVALANGAAIVAVNSLQALAWQCWQNHRHEQGEQEILVINDARMQEVYCARFVAHGNSVLAADEAQCLALAAVAAPQPGGWIIGSAVTLWPEALRTLFPAALCINELSLEASSIAALGVEMLSAGHALQAKEAAPLYVRNKVAQTTAERLSNGGRV